MGTTYWGQVEVWYLVVQLQPVIGQLACTGRGGVMRMIMIIIKRTFSYTHSLSFPFHPHPPISLSLPPVPPLPPSPPHPLPLSFLPFPPPFLSLSPSPPSLSSPPPTPTPLVLALFSFFLHNIIIFFIITAVVSVVTILLRVANWHVDLQGEIVRTGNKPENLQSLCNKVLSSELRALSSEL